MKMKKINKKATVRCGIHAEKQKFRLNEEKEDKALDLFKEKGLELQYDYIGAKLSFNQQRAIFAIQILTDAYYGSNDKGKDKPNDSLPQLEVKRSDYFEAYGVKTAAEKIQSLKALKNIADTKIQMYYERARWVANKEGKKEQLFDLMIWDAPFVRIIRGYRDLTKPQVKKVKSGRLTKAEYEKLYLMLIEPSRVIIDQLETFFVLQDRNLYQSIKQLSNDRPSRYAPLFISWLILQVEMKRRKKDWSELIKISWQKLARTLGMASWIKTRQWGRIKEELLKCFKIAERRGYLWSHNSSNSDIENDIQLLFINSEKFPSYKKQGNLDDTL